MFFEPRAVNDAFNGTVPAVSFIGHDDIENALGDRGLIFVSLTSFKQMARCIAP